MRGLGLFMWSLMGASSRPTERAADTRTALRWRVFSDSPNIGQARTLPEQFAYFRPQWYNMYSVKDL
jgi:hypothetical protein